MKKIFIPLSVIAILFVLFLGFTVSQYRQLETMVEKRFDGQLWELPAQVYARPMELYPYLEIQPDSFEEELQFLGYPALKEMPLKSSAIGYSRKGNVFTLSLRSFDFGDHAVAERKVIVSIGEGRVTDIKDRLTDVSLDSMTLDPVVLGRFYPSSMEDRIIATENDIPNMLQQTLIAVEDQKFYNHKGIDLPSMVRATLVNLKKGKFSQGASTLTQQLARNFFLTREKTLSRKYREILTALIMEQKFSKEQILEAYINEVYLGQEGRRSIHGFGVASDFYFGKSLQDLHSSEIALLVGMLKGPSYFDPRQRPENALTRRNQVLHIMANTGIIDREDLEEQLAMDLGVVTTANRGHSPFPFYQELVKRHLLRDYAEEDLRTMGLRIFTALDPQVQLAAEKAVVDFFTDRDDALETGLVISSRSSNEIQAVVGGKNPHYKGFNRALDAKRPIGSLVKPAVYLAALSEPAKYNMMSRVDDAPIKIANPDGTFWQPNNFDKKSHGQVSLYTALAKSYNLSTVQLGMDIGLQPVAHTLNQLGAQVNGDPLPSMLLGSLEMSPLEVVQMYHTIASGGFHSPVKTIRSVYTEDGTLVQQYPLTVEERIDPGTIFLITKMLQACVAEGTGKGLARWIPNSMGIAGKTGTSNGYRDSWFAGFSGDRVASVWVGKDDNSSTGLTGGSGALHIFGRTLASISLQPLNPIEPSNIEWAVIDPITGAQTNQNCPGAVSVPFISGYVPESFRSCTTSAPQRRTRSNGFFNWLEDTFK